MSFPKILAIVSTVLFFAIAVAAFFKQGSDEPAEATSVATRTEISPSQETKALVVANPKPILQPTIPGLSGSGREPPADVDRTKELFNKREPRLPIVETIVYKSRVPWQKGRPAWLSDYANHYRTSRHFIARGRNGKPDYTKQDVADGDRFNVYNPAVNFSFYLLVDTTRSKMWLFYINQDTNQHVLIKTYPVGLGRVDNTSPSGLLTPYGKYQLGSKTAVYKPKVMGTYNGKRAEMITVFGTRWIPFCKEISGCTASPAGFGIHGVPWILGPSGELVEKNDLLGKYESDGGVRLSTADIEELYAIITLRSAEIEIVKDYFDAQIAEN